MSDQNGNTVIRACAIARNLEQFGQLIVELEAVFGAGWGGLGFADAESILASAHAADLEIAVIGVNQMDESSLGDVEKAIQLSKAKGLKVVLVTNDLGPGTLHQLMRSGVDDFLPYPLPPKALAETIERISRPALPSPEALPAAQASNLPTPVMQPQVPAQARQGIIFPVFGLSGGVGATTFSTNFAWELTNLVAAEKQTVCILDLNFQFGSVATYLDVGRSDGIIELMSNPDYIDTSSMEATMARYEHVLDVLPAPTESMPLDFVGPEEITKLLDTAASMYDYVIVDMPSSITIWTDVVLDKAQLFFALLEMDMRSAHNALRFLRALKAEDMPFEKVQFIMNRAPKATDLSGKSRMKRMADSLDVQFRWFLPEGGRQVPNSCDHGQPLGQTAKKNVLRKEILRIATTMVDLSQQEVA